MKPIIASKRRVSLTATVLAPLVLALATLAGCVNVRVPDIPQIPRIPDIPGGRTDGAVVSELGFGTLVITDEG